LGVYHGLWPANRRQPPNPRSGSGENWLKARAEGLFTPARSWENRRRTQPAPSRRRRENAPLPTILTIRRHWLPVIARQRAIVISNIADATIDIREG
jgi:hypothetical protein